MKTDSLFYRLFQEQPGLVFELAGWPLPEGAAYTLRAEEVKQTSFRLDGVLVPPPEAPALPVVFVEAQFQGDPDFYPRCFTELFLFLYRQRWPGPWRLVVIFPSRAMDGDPPVAYQPLLASAWVRQVYLEGPGGADGPDAGLTAAAADHCGAGGSGERGAGAAGGAGRTG